MKALFIVFMIRTYICDSLDKIVEKNGPPAQNCRPLGQLKKMFKDTRFECLNPNWVRFQWQEYQTKALNKYFTNHIQTYS